MVLISIRCPHCDSDQGVKRGRTENAKQRYRCQQLECPAQTFILDYDYHGYLPEIKKRIKKESILPRISQPSGAGTLESE